MGTGSRVSGVGSGPAGAPRHLRPVTRPPSRFIRWARADPKRLLVYVLLTLAGLVSLFPLYWLFLTSLSPSQYYLKVPPELVPRDFTLANYERLFAMRANFSWGATAPLVLVWLANSVLMAGAITLFHCLFDSMAGYAFAKRRFPGKDIMFWLVLSTLTVPSQVTLVPVFLIIKELGLLDNYLGVIAPGLADVFGVFLMKQYIQTLPTEMEQAARVDGASEWQIYRHIILPLCTPALAVLAIFTFQRYWNDFLRPLVLLRDSFKFPIQVGLATLQGEFNTDYGMLMTGAAVAAVPMIVVFLLFQRHFVEGIRIGAVKG